MVPHCEREMPHPAVSIAATLVTIIPDSCTQLVVLPLYGPVIEVETLVPASILVNRDTYEN